MPEYYVNGGIYDESGQPLKGVTIQLVSNATSQGISTPTTLNSEFYEAWTNQNDTTVAVLFKKKGYKTVKIQLSVLATNPTVTMMQGEEIPWAAIVLVAGVAAFYMKRNKKVGKLNTGDTMVIFLLIGGVLAFDVIQKILDKLGLGGDPTQSEQNDPNSPWKPGYWQQFSTYTYAITESTARTYAKTIHDAFTVMNDDYNAILSVFNSMRTKANVSFLAYVFRNEYNEDLLSFLTDGGGILPWDGLSNTHLKTLTNLVDRLPKN